MTELQSDLAFSYEDFVCRPCLLSIIASPDFGGLFSFKVPDVKMTNVSSVRMAWLDLEFTCSL